MELLHHLSIPVLIVIFNHCLGEKTFDVTVKEIVPGTVIIDFGTKDPSVKTCTINDTLKENIICSNNKVLCIKKLEDGRKDFTLKAKFVTDNGVEAGIIHVHIGDTGGYSIKFADVMAIPEEMTPGTKINQLFSVTGVKDTDKLKYSFQGDDSKHLLIDSATGSLNSGLPVDRDGANGRKYLNRLTLVVVINDAKSLSSPVKIYVTDVNDNAPTYIKSEWSVEAPENSTKNTIATLLCIDRDEGANAEIVQTIVAPANSPFSISGNFLIADVLDYEGVRYDDKTYILTVMAVDQPTNGPALSSNTIVKVKVLPVNEFPPVWASPFTGGNGSIYKHDVVKNIPLATLLFTLKATDEDEGKGGQLTYGDTPILTGNGSVTPFVFLVKGSGEVHALKDITAPSVYILHVFVTDKGVPPKSINAKITIRILDYVPTTQANAQPPVNSLRWAQKDKVLPVNEFPPVWASPFTGGNGSIYKHDVVKSIPVAALLFTLKATDEDEGKGGQLTYGETRTLTGNGRETPFVFLVKGSGEVHAIKDITAPSVYILHVFVTDKGEPPKSINAKITIRILDYVPTTQANAQPPVNSLRWAQKDTNGNIVVELPRDTNVGTILTTVKADGGEGPITYQIGGVELDGKPTKEKMLFLMQNDRVMALKTADDYKEKANHFIKVTVVAVSGGTEKQQIECTVTINVGADSAPKNHPLVWVVPFSGGDGASGTVHVNETLKPGSDVTRVRASYSETGTVGKVTYRIGSIVTDKGADATNQFNFDPNTGLLKTMYSLDLEEGAKSFRVKLNAIDERKPQQTIAGFLTIEIRDINEYPPALGESLYKATVSCDKQEGDDVLRLKMTDKDATSTFKLTSTRKSDFVEIKQIGPNTAVVFLIAWPRHESYKGKKTFKEYFPLLLSDGGFPKPETSTGFMIITYELCKAGVPTPTPKPTHTEPPPKKGGNPEDRTRAPVKPKPARPALTPEPRHTDPPPKEGGNPEDRTRAPVKPKPARPALTPEPRHTDPPPKEGGNPEDRTRAPVKPKPARPAPTPKPTHTDPPPKEGENPEDRTRAPVKPKPARPALTPEPRHTDPPPKEGGNPEDRTRAPVKPKPARPALTPEPRHTDPPPKEGGNPEDRTRAPVKPKPARPALTPEPRHTDPPPKEGGNPEDRTRAPVKPKPARPALTPKPRHTDPPPKEGGNPEDRTRAPVKPKPARPTLTPEPRHNDPPPKEGGNPEDRTRAPVKPKPARPALTPEPRHTDPPPKEGGNPEDRTRAPVKPKPARPALTPEPRHTDPPPKEGENPEDRTRAPVKPKPARPTLTPEPRYTDPPPKEGENPEDRTRAPVKPKPARPALTPEPRHTDPPPKEGENPEDRTRAPVKPKPARPALTPEPRHTDPPPKEGENPEDRTRAPVKPKPARPALTPEPRHTDPPPKEGGNPEDRTRAPVKPKPARPALTPEPRHTDPPPKEGENPEDRTRAPVKPKPARPALTPEPRHTEPPPKEGENPEDRTRAPVKPKPARPALTPEPRHTDPPPKEGGNPEVRTRAPVQPMPEAPNPTPKPKHTEPPPKEGDVGGGEGNPQPATKDNKLEVSSEPAPDSVTVEDGEVTDSTLTWPEDGTASSESPPWFVPSSHPHDVTLRTNTDDSHKDGNKPNSIPGVPGGSQGGGGDQSAEWVVRSLCIILFLGYVAQGGMYIAKKYSLIDLDCIRPKTAVHPRPDNGDGHENDNGPSASVVDYGERQADNMPDIAAALAIASPNFMDSYPRELPQPPTVTNTPASMPPTPSVPSVPLPPIPSIQTHPPPPVPPLSTTTSQMPLKYLPPLPESVRRQPET